MNTIPFYNKWLFRIMGPILTGSIIYLLILLLNNNIDQLLQSFITDEYAVCTVIALIILEALRFVLIKNASLIGRLTPSISIVAVLILASILTALIVIVVMSLFFVFVIGYQPNLTELQPFIILYIGLSIAYATVYISNHYIQSALTDQLNNEKQLEQQSKESFLRLTRGINPELLFESLESLITLMHEDKDKADDMIDDLSIVYRYTLSKSSIKLINIKEELFALYAFERLVNNLPYRNIKISEDITTETNLIPGSLLILAEAIVKNTITRKDQALVLDINTSGQHICISYKPQDKLNTTIDLSNLEELSTSYKVYTDSEIKLEEKSQLRKICIPNLLLQSE